MILCYNISEMEEQLLSATQGQYAFECDSNSPEQTLCIGQRLGTRLERGALILLIGDFGVGKTQLVKGIARGLGSADLVTSPSFVLINEYHAGGQHHDLCIYHVDLYRIEDPSELAGIGLEEMVNDPGICLIEWADHATDWFSADHLAIYIQDRGAISRTLRFVPHGRRYHHVVEELQKALVE